MIRTLFCSLVATGLFVLLAPQTADASPILSLMSEKGVSIIEKISISPDPGDTGTLGDDDLGVVFDTDDLADYKALKKLVKKKVKRFKRSGKNKLKVALDGNDLDLAGKLKGKQLKVLLRDLKGMKGEFTVVPTGSIPEPGTLALLATGMLGLAAVNRRLRSGS